MSDIMHNRSSMSSGISYPLKHVVPLPRRETHYHPNPDRESLQPEKAMTIAACFEFDDGILFCADTKITSDVKTNQSKIFARVYPDNYCATTFVLTGIVPYAKAAIEKCERRIAKLDSLTVSIDQVQDEIESTLVDFYEKHVFPRPDKEKVSFDLLGGIWLRGETRMFVSSETTVSTVQDYECLGSGAYLARYWIRQFFASDPAQPRRTLEDVALISAYALKSAMDYDEYCGGQAEFLIMRNNGEFGKEVDSAVPLNTCEEWPDRFQKAMWKMMRKLIHTENEVDACSIMEDFQDEIRKLGKTRTDWISLLSLHLKESIAKPEGESPSPEKAAE